MLIASMVHVGMQETHYRQREDRFCRPPACQSLRLLPDGNFWAAAVAGLGPRWRPVADPGCGHEWCHWGRQEAALRAMVSALSEHFDKTLRFVSPPPATGPPRRTRTGLRTRTITSSPRSILETTRFVHQIICSTYRFRSNTHIAATARGVLDR